MILLLMHVYISPPPKPRSTFTHAFLSVPVLEHRLNWRMTLVPCALPLCRPVMQLVRPRRTPTQRSWQEAAELNGRLATAEAAALLARQQAADNESFGCIRESLSNQVSAAKAPCSEFNETVLCKDAHTQQGHGGFCTE